MYYLYTIRSVVSLFACVGFKTANVNHKKKIQILWFFLLKKLSTVSPRINVHALIFEDALGFRKKVHALIVEHNNKF